jgi:5-methylcytosine-specific restriction endonuclease McrA
MPRYQQLSDAALTHGFDTSWSREDAAAADVLEYIADFDERKLYVPAGYPSLLDYCVGKLKRTRDSVRRQIHAAHTAQRFPLVFEYVRQGKLSVSAVIQLAPYLSEENAAELLSEASFRSKDEIAQLIRHRLEDMNPPTLIESIETSPTADRASNGTVVTETVSSLANPCVPERTQVSEPERSCVSQPVHLDQEMEDLVSRAQTLLGYELRSDDPKEVIRRSLRVLVGQLEKRTARRARLVTPRPATRPSTNPRHIPNAIMSVVWKRDAGVCTFVGENGHRCRSRRHLEFDHIVPVARGGESTVSNLRLRCRAHNQFEAERTLGSDFMKHKREEAKPAADDLDVVPWLRQLGYRADQAKRAAAHCETLATASLEDRVRAALKFLAPPHRKFFPSQGESAGVAV